MAAPFLLPGRLILQEVSSTTRSWDEPVPAAIEIEWSKWLTDLPKLTELKVPRTFKPTSLGPVVSSELHCFADASAHAYGAVAYLRLEDGTGLINVSFVLGRARVAPRKPTTIPRMELVAAVLATTIVAQARRELKIEGLKCFFWTDSMVVLGYIFNDVKRFHLFVANRVRKIKEISSKEEWRHIQSSENPADDASRGLLSVNVNKTHRWFRGPEFLWKCKGDWEASDERNFDVLDDDVEIKKDKMVCLTNVETPSFIQSMVDSYSSVSKIRKLIATWLQFIQFLRFKIKPDRTRRVEALSKALRILVKWDQERSFGNEYKVLSELTGTHTATRKRLLVKSGSPLAKLAPFLDDNGIIRVGGRLNKLVDEEVNPMILPKKSRLSSLIVESHHRQVGHAGRGITINAIRNSGFWLLGINSLVRGHISRCVRCKRLRDQTEEPKMANLPLDRLQKAPPFTFVGVDFFGPFIIRNKLKDEKRYGAIFSCLNSRAIHIEVAHSLDTSSYIGCLRRMLARRGPIRLLRSENGLNFVGAEREMSEALQEMEEDKVAAFLNERGSDYEGWKRNPPYASNFGGA